MRAKLTDTTVTEADKLIDLIRSIEQAGKRISMFKAIRNSDGSYYVVYAAESEAEHGS